ncbi:hypothetical protein J3E68DRAFT_393299 [Trichoderma sp. SZMC 28012]
MGSSGSGNAVFNKIGHSSSGNSLDLAPNPFYKLYQRTLPPRVGTHLQAPMKRRSHSKGSLTRGSLIRGTLAMLAASRA